MFTDIVGATARAAEIGDRNWKDLLSHHHHLVREQLGRFRGREIDTAGDGFLAAFDGPARAVRCAQAIAEAVKPNAVIYATWLPSGESLVTYDEVGAAEPNTVVGVNLLISPVCNK